MREQDPLTLSSHQRHRNHAITPRSSSPSPSPTIARVAIGNGATGSAWERREMFLVTGAEVRNAKYGLTAEQQAYFKAYRAVVATPLWDDKGAAFGVLTAISKANDGFFDTDTGGRDSFKTLADVVGVALRRVAEPTDLQ